MKISIIVPFFNEEKTIQAILENINANKIEYAYEIILVDDGSTDSSLQIIEELNLPQVKIVRHQKNQGKGAAIRTGLQQVTGDIVIIQDADLEYDPQDYSALINPIVIGQSKVVYGSRLLHRTDRYSYLRYYLGGKFLSLLANLLYGIHITDESTGYKVFAADFLKGLPLTCTQFEFCPEVTALVAKAHEKIIEVPISYHPRNFAEGKKIRVKDGLMAIWVLLKYRISR